MSVISTSSWQAQGKICPAGSGNLNMEARGERLSAIIDGELPDDECLVDALSGFTDEDRAAWSCYHLIGDVLRSDNLALAPAKSAAFLAKFSARLQAEPRRLTRAAIFTPVARPLAVLRRAAPTLAVAASAAVLTWIAVPQLHGTGGVPVAAHDDPIQRVSLDSGARNGNLIRDARLNAYLEAHQQFGQQPGMQDVTPYMQSASLSSQGQDQ